MTGWGWELWSVQVEHPDKGQTDIISQIYTCFISAAPQSPSLSHPMISFKNRVISNLWISIGKLQCSRHESSTPIFRIHLERLERSDWLKGMTIEFELMKLSPPPSLWTESDTRSFHKKSFHPSLSLSLLIFNKIHDWKFFNQFNFVVTMLSFFFIKKNFSSDSSWAIPFIFDFSQASSSGPGDEFPAAAPSPPPPTCPSSQLSKLQEILDSSGGRRWDMSIYSCQFRPNRTCQLCQ